MNESEMAMQIMRRWRSRKPEDGLEFTAEEPYANFGERGYVDLHVEHRDGSEESHHLYELKSDYALDQVTGANEILRQFNKMREHYAEANRLRRNHEHGIDVKYYLVFEVSERCVAHGLKYQPLYRTVPFPLKSGGSPGVVTFLHPEETSAGIHLGALNTPMKQVEWDSYVESHHPELWEAYSAVEGVYSRE